MGTIHKVAWVRVRNRRMLCVRSKGVDLFYSPGGKPKRGESDVDALVREIQEELGVALLRETINRVETFVAQADGKPEGALVAITCYEAQCVGEPHPASEVEEIAWLSRADGKKTTEAGRLILNWLREHGHID